MPLWGLTLQPFLRVYGTGGGGLCDQESCAGLARFCHRLAEVRDVRGPRGSLHGPIGGHCPHIHPPPSGERAQQVECFASGDWWGGH